MGDVASFEEEEDECRRVVLILLVRRLTVFLCIAARFSSDCSIAMKHANECGAKTNGAVHVHGARTAAQACIVVMRA